MKKKWTTSWPIAQAYRSQETYQKPTEGWLKWEIWGDNVDFGLFERKSGVVVWWAQRKTREVPKKEPYCWEEENVAW